MLSDSASATAMAGVGYLVKIGISSTGWGVIVELISSVAINYLKEQIKKEVQDNEDNIKKTNAGVIICSYLVQRTGDGKVLSHGRIPSVPIHTLNDASTLDLDKVLPISNVGDTIRQYVIVNAACRATSVGTMGESEAKAEAILKYYPGFNNQEAVKIIIRDPNEE